MAWAGALEWREGSGRLGMAAQPLVGWLAQWWGLRLGLGWVTGRLSGRWEPRKGRRDRRAGLGAVGAAQGKRQGE